jgi:hypothetical protein
MVGGWHIGSSWSSPQDFASVTSGGTGLSGVTSGATAFGKGAWTEVVSATTADTQWFYFQMVKFAGEAVSVAIDIGIGASGSEIALASNLLAAGADRYLIHYVLPLSIKSGSRIAIRTASDLTSYSSFYKAGAFNDSAFSGMGGVSAIDTYGFVSASGHGTAVDPGATANTKGAYAQIVSSTTSALDGFMLAFDCLSRTTGTADSDYLFDIAIGASGSERVVLPNIWCGQTDSGTTTWLKNTQYFPIQIPAGSRIAARAQSGYTTAADRSLGLTLYGMRR